jgi:hypothetical protein
VGGTLEWRIVAFEVNRATGTVTQTGYYYFARSVNQFYCSFADANNESGNQTLRVSLYHNPAYTPNMIWYLEIDCVTGEVSSPFDGGISHNVLTATSTLQVHGGSDSSPNVTPAVAHNAAVDRRMFYCTAGPFAPRILYAEGDAVDRDSWVYYALNVDTLDTEDYGAAGTRFGYVDTANYLPGMCAPDPAYDDTTFLARNPIEGNRTLEQWWTSRGVLTSEILISTSATIPIRPYMPKNGGPFLMYYDLTSYGVGGTFYSTGSIRSVKRR